ncbi:MAG: hypothetical protein KBG84_15945 [Planctomycetes bacterium]|nr:hypothetical protein [Planctomycetota bacterium]
MTPFEAAKLGLLKQLAKWPAQSFVALRRGVERSLPVAAINEIDGALEQIRKEKLAYVFDFMDRQWSITDAGRSALMEPDLGAARVATNEFKVLQALSADRQGWSNDMVIALEIWRKDHPGLASPGVVELRNLADFTGFELWPVLYALRELGLVRAETSRRFMWVLGLRGESLLAESGESINSGLPH